MVAALLALAVAWWAAPVPAYATVPLPIDAVFTGNGQTSLVVDLSASTKPGRRSVTVTRDGVPQPAELVPVMNDDLAVTLVVDTSAAARAALPAWLSGAARFILEAPANTRGVIIADTKPAAPITGPQRGPTGIVRALTAVQARGERDTGAALTLAANQFPASPAGHRVTVLYTTAADAGGETAAELAARFRAAGTILVVAGTADGGTYWADVAAATGGFFAPAGNPVVVPALDQVQTTLSSRYLVVFRTPPRLPARVAVQVGTGDLTLTGYAVVPAPGASAAGPSGGVSAGPIVWWSLSGAGLVGLIAVVFLLWRRRAGAGASPAAAPAPAPAQPPAGRSAPARVAWATGRNGPPAGAGWNTPAADRNGMPAAADRTGTPSAADRAGMPPAIEGAGVADTAIRPRVRAAPPTLWAGNLPVYELPEGPVPRLPDGAPLVARGRAAVPPSVVRGRAAVPGAAQPPEPDAAGESASAAATHTETETGYSE